MMNDTQTEPRRTERHKTAADWFALRLDRAVQHARDAEPADEKRRAPDEAVVAVGKLLRTRK